MNTTNKRHKIIRICTKPITKLFTIVLIVNLCFLNKFTCGFSSNLIHTSNVMVRHHTMQAHAVPSLSPHYNKNSDQRTKRKNGLHRRVGSGSTGSSSSLYSSMKEKQDNHNPNPVDIYVEYVQRLWNETSTQSRETIANQRAYYAIKDVQHLLKEGEEYVNIMNHHDGDTLDDIENKKQAKQDLLRACNNMLAILGPIEEIADTPTIASDDAKDGSDKDQLKEILTIQSSDETKDFPSNAKAVAPIEEGKKAPKKKQSRSIFFGASMGAIVACWLFSGNFLFTSLFTLMTVLGQLEYYRMVMRVGIYPARKISVVGACAMFVTALFAPSLHQICLPIFATYAMIWFLTMRRKVTTIPEIASTFTGMFYLGYVPSFWVRIRLINGTPDQPATLLQPIVAPLINTINRYAETTLPYFFRFIHSPITDGSVFIFWTWISIAFSDVGAYFMGRKYGKTKLGSIFPAAGAASPNKTVEGYLGGTLFSSALATTGAWIMQWPYWYLTGPIHGILLAFLGLVGDLTASMLKRDSGMKDFGDLLPEHGGIMDRVDSFIFTAPYSWLVCQFIIPALRARSRLAIP